ncbi:caspase recruitment domain-containing protein [Aphelenchoides avenae]|nr:caspase recruitment domain-containing protein [Aphelenchus avenae]
MPGRGKTSLVSVLLWSNPEIEGHHFKRIVWLTDGNMERDGVINVVKDALALLNPQVLLQNEAPTSDVTLWLQTELECGDRYLIVLDDVWWEKTVRYFDGFKCSFIATTTNTEIFSLLEEKSVLLSRLTATASSIGKSDSWPPAVGFRRPKKTCPADEGHRMQPGVDREQHATRATCREQLAA